MKKLLLSSLFGCLLVSASALALAKLPAPSDEAKAKAAEAAAKAAWAGKVEGSLLCKSQDKVAAGYYKSATASGKETKPAAAVPACVEPGVFAYTPPAAVKPLEASGAHSPAATATSPPSSKMPAAEIAPAKKP